MNNFASSRVKLTWSCPRCKVPLILSRNGETLYTTEPVVAKEKKKVSLQETFFKLIHKGVEIVGWVAILFAFILFIYISLTGSESITFNF